MIWLLVFVGKVSERVEWPRNTQRTLNGVNGRNVVAVTEKSRESEAITGNVTSIFCPHPPVRNVEGPSL